MQIGKVQVDRKRLMPKNELLNLLEENGENDRTLSQIRDRQHEEFGSELIWRYPTSDDKHTGMFIAAVREGFICIPYDAIGLEEWECLDLQNAAMLTAESLEVLINSWRLLSDDLLSVMNDILVILTNK